MNKAESFKIFSYGICVHVPGALAFSFLQDFSHLLCITIILVSHFCFKKDEKDEVPRAIR